MMMMRIVSMTMMASMVIIMMTNTTCSTFMTMSSAGSYPDPIQLCLAAVGL